MKRILLGLFIIFALTGYSQEKISTVEYFFDSDPGYGNGTTVSVTPGNVLDVGFQASTANLSSGIHTMYVRAKAGNWSQTYSRIIGVSATDAITNAEYFYDTDPGYGKGTAIAVTPGKVATLDFTASTTGLSTGIHTMYLRTKSGNWSQTFSRMIGIAANDGISAAEYFFDTDPGYGKGTAITVTPGKAITLDFSASTSGLSAGVHTLFLRTKSGNWSQTFSRVIGVSGTDVITQAEYFFDTDPGYGKGTAITVTSGNVVSLDFDANTSGLPSGIHTIYVRAKSGNWGQTYSRIFGVSSTDAITRAEYFYDTDPGYGKGTNIPITSGNVVSLDFAANTANLSTGIHTLYIRAEAGNWGGTYSRIIGISGTDLVSAAEYFFDTDPGYGKGTAITVTSGKVISLDFAASTAGLSPGIHTMYMRAKSGNWGQTYSRIIGVSSSSAITAAEYFYDTDPGYGKGTNIPVTSGNIVSLDFGASTSGLRAGIHTLYIRAKAENWGQIHSQRIAVTENDSIVYAEYYWDNDPGFGSAMSVPVTPAKIVSLDFAADVSALALGTHYLHVRAKTAGGVWGLENVETFCNKPDVDFTVTNACFGASNQFVLVPTSVNDSTKYSWDFTQDSVADFVDSTSILYTFGAKGAFNVMLIASQPDGCADTVVKTASVFDPANAEPAKDVSICAAEYTLKASDGFESYTWNTGDLTQEINVTASGSYSYTATTSSGCSFIDTVSVALNTPPTVSVAADKMAICHGDTTKLVASGAATYKWENLGSDNDTVSIEPIIETKYTVIGASEEGCVDTATITIYVNPLPVVSVVADNDTITAGGTVKLQASGATNYVWNDASESDVLSAQPVQTTLYAVTGTDPNGCSDTATISIYVQTGYVHVSSIAMSASQVTLPKGEGYSAEITVLPSNASDPSVQWITSSEYVAGVENGKIIANHPGIAIITCVSVEDNTISATITVTVPCVTVTKSISATSCGSYIWDSIQYSASGLYEKTYKTVEGCDSVVSLSLIVNSGFNLLLKASSETIEKGGITTLFASGAQNYEWSTNNDHDVQRDGY